MGAEERDQPKQELVTALRTLSRVHIDRQRLENFCRKHALHRLSFFGSVLREDFGSDSDVDVLAEFMPGRTPGFLRLFEMQDELSAILGRKTDLMTREDLSPYFRDDVLRTAEMFYDAA